MSRAISIISDIPSNKAGIKLFADAIISAVFNGDTDPLEVRAKMDAIEKIVKTVKDDERFRDVLQDRAEMEPDKTFEFNGVKFTKAEATRFDYSGDEVWGDLKEKEKEAAEDRKEAEELLKSLRKPTEIDGVLRIPPVKNSTSHVRVTF
jgi:hypothetical protein